MSHTDYKVNCNFSKSNSDFLVIDLNSHCMVLDLEIPCFKKNYDKK